ncbi:MAG: acyltransferase [Bacteroidia bacterium]|nr:acyltransferase [Bacteroidia bacterium]
MVNEFDDIHPYHDSEIPEAMQRIVNNPFFGTVVKFFYPDVPIEAIKAKFLTFTSVYGFQANFMDFAIRSIVKKTSSGLSYNGFEHLLPSKNYIFISNHRDILLDSAILQILLFANKLDTSEISFGDNLMSSEFIIDIGKSNKMFRLTRGGTPKQIFANSMNTSKYIRYAINEKMQSVWIAQRNGRTKDGNDQTQQAVLKMFGMSGGDSFSQKFSELNIAPIAVSYEYDPCDFMKTSEIYISRRQAYVKAPGEDVKSIITGIKQFKGRIHLAVTPPVSDEELLRIEDTPESERIQGLATLIDNRIFQNYKLWNTHYIAYDMLFGATFESIYSASEKAAFADYMNKMLSKIEGDKVELESIFLGIYANPVVNHIKVNGTVKQEYKGTPVILESS